ncbi:MAG: protein-glutamate O-methyltransferase CheR, partial [Candidatus Tectomicrobia bacterium]|nr:protein-glutamate O-methyltransferase CheR [Candidatus Tectomicrobia bacterium]
MDDYEFGYLKRKVLAWTGIDLDSYKSQHMRRRLDSVVFASSCSVIQYCERLQNELETLRKLRDFLTINVSEFFRDTEQFDLLKNAILPDLLTRNHKLNIWSAGCSHGGEPYSVAMILDEISPGVKHRILATDIDEGVLARARNRGPYSSQDVRNVGRFRLQKYFAESPGGYWIKDVVKQEVEFRQLNLLGDCFETGFDLILCRNVIIYFTEKAKARLIEGFYKSLKDNGVLF